MARLELVTTGGSPAVGTGTWFSLLVEQTAAGLVIARRQARWRFSVPPLTPADSDQVAFTGGNSESWKILGVTGRDASGCQAHQPRSVYYAVGWIGPWLAPEGCPASLYTASEANRVALLRDAPFTDTNDVLSVSLSPVIEVPVVIWITRPSDDDSYASLVASSRMELLDASATFEAMFCGITFFEELGEPQDRREKASNAQVQNDCDRNDLPRVDYKDGALNVYYAGLHTKNWGMWGCTKVEKPKKQPLTAMIVINPPASPDTLLHELGEAVGLSEIDNLPPRNLMSDDSDRGCITLGQCYRATVEPSSVVNMLGLRSGEWSESCPDAGASDTCPSAVFDTPRPTGDWSGANCDQLEAEGEPGVLAVVRRWFDCERCTEGQFESLREMGQAAIRALSATLVLGPGIGALERERYQLEARFDRIASYSARRRGRPVPMTRTEYVETYKRGFENRQRIKAAIALGRIGGHDARQALQRALAIDLAPDVRAAVRDSLEAMR